MQDIEMNLQEYDIPVIPRDKDIYTTVGKRIFKEKLINLEKIQRL